MKHEKIFIREDKSKIKIIVTFRSDSWIHSAPEWNYEIEKQAAGKRKWIKVEYDNDYKWRNLSMEDRRKYEHKKNLEIVTEKEILEAKLEFWEIIKPI